MTNPIKLSLFVASKDSPTTTIQITTIKDLLNSSKEKNYTFNIYELFEDWQKARDIRILATPTLIKETANGESRLIGNLLNKNDLLNFLSIE